MGEGQRVVGNLALGKLLLLSLSFLPRTGARISDLPPSGVKMGATEMGICSYLAVTTHSTSVGHERHRQMACSQGGVVPQSWCSLQDLPCHAPHPFSTWNRKVPFIDTMWRWGSTLTAALCVPGSSSGRNTLPKQSIGMALFRR